MPKLKFLDLNNNKILYFGIFPGHYQTLTNVESLNVLKMSNNLLNKKCFESFKFPKLEYMELKNTEILFESVELQISKNFINLRNLKEIEIAESVGIDTFKEAEGQDIRILLLTVAPQLRLINGEPVKDDETQAAKQMLQASCISQFKNEIKNLVVKEKADE